MPSFDPSKNKTLQILSAAEKGGYGVIAPVIYNLEQLLACIRAAESKRSPLIIQVFPWAITFSSGLLVHFAAQAAKSASVPISVHLDHAQDEDQIRHAAKALPFDSIMVDMSHHERVENLAKTKELTSLCHENGIAVEAEPGRIEGGEDGIADTKLLEGVMTTKEDVEEFIDCGVDLLAPAFGNIHGEYGKRGPQFDFGRLETVRREVNGRVGLAMHGTNGLPEHVSKECIKCGISKVNVNKSVWRDYLSLLKANASTMPLTRLMEEGVEAAQKLLEWQMDVCGSTGKAKTTRVNEP